jgi:zinc/manganese transport system substrate-binding protein
MKTRRAFLLVLSMLCCFRAASANAQMKVAATHPILGDLVRQVGGSGVTVVDLLKPGGDIHHFEPTASELRTLVGVKIVFASGKHLENYLPRLQDSLGAGVVIEEVGRTIPSLKIAQGSELFLCCPEHAVGGIDPHWWHSAENMARAARIVAKALSAGDPAGADRYKVGGEATAKKMLALKAWAQQQFAVIPRGERKLVTAHAAFGYFCKEYGFQFIPMLGLSREDDFSPKYINAAVKTIRDNKIKAAFPEDQANPKILKSIIAETGIKVAATPLAADGTSKGLSTFETMFRHNVASILATLRATAP